MTNFPSNPNSPPPGLDESDLLALIEGTPIPAERAARLRECLANDPRLAELAALMRADRDAVASFPEVSAPADLLDRVEVLLEREALVGLARTEATAATHDLPVSAVIPARRPWLSLRYGAPMAAAAAVLLIAGGVMMLVSVKPPAVVPKAGPDAANNTTGTPGDLARNDHPVVKGDPDPVDNRPPVVIANKPEPAVTPVGTEPTVTPAPSAVARAAPAIPPEQLLAAAQSGTLVLRLRTSEEKAIGRVRAFNTSGRSHRIQNMAERDCLLAGRAYANAWSSRQPAIELPRPVPAVPDMVVTGTEPPPAAPLVGPLANQATPATPREPAPVVASHAYIAAIPATIEELESLRASINNETVPADWQILPEPLVLEAPTDAASILWWTAQPPAWSRRFCVPIIVQSN